MISTYAIHTAIQRPARTSWEPAATSVFSRPVHGLRTTISLAKRRTRSKLPPTTVDATQCLDESVYLRPASHGSDTNLPLTKATSIGIGFSCTMAEPHHDSHAERLTLKDRSKPSTVNGKHSLGDHSSWIRRPRLDVSTHTCAV